MQYDVPNFEKTGKTIFIATEDQQEKIYLFCENLQKNLFFRVGLVIV